MDCRVTGCSDLEEVFVLGDQAYTGYFPHSKSIDIPKARLALSLAKSSKLVQMSHRYDSNLMYGENYGYQSGLNSSMRTHLHNIAERIRTLIPHKEGDVFLDIGSNDGTLLNSPALKDYTKYGIDPSAFKFKSKYEQGSVLITDFFSKEIFLNASPKRASIITTISMFYDLDDPVGFARDVYESLEDNGVWFLEQSYLPAMLLTNSFDTICHEHYEYYSLTSLRYILELAGFTILNISFNDVNGGSFSVLAGKTQEYLDIKNSCLVDWTLKYEELMGIDTPEPFIEFEKRVQKNKDDLMRLLLNIKKSNSSIAGLGASTKGNVLLQYYGIDESLLPVIGDINPDKYNCFTPGSKIPIISEEEVLRIKPDFLFILPWHFKATFLKNLEFYRKQGGKIIFPLPFVQVY